MIDFSVILPCYNEADSIPKILAVFAEFLPEENGELILVNNGSDDATASLEEEMTKQYPFIKWITIEKNKGYGHGIYTGLAYAKARYMGYTHADLQTDPYDVYKAIKLIRNSDNKHQILVKGIRRDRNFIASLFSKGLEVVASAILKKKLYEINAQPVVFSADLFGKLDNIPAHWGFDLYIYYKASLLNYNFKRFEVHFPKRTYGQSKWQVGFMPRLSFSYRMLKYCFELYKHENLRTQDKHN